MEGLGGIRFSLDGIRTMNPFKRKRPIGPQIKNIHKGRIGIIRYENEGKILEIEWELSGVKELDILLAPMELNEWKMPTGEKVPRNEQLVILKELRKWLKSKKIRTDIDLSDDIQFENENCRWVNCTNCRIKGKAYCVDHFDEILLRKQE
jgi:hypothetical protein